MNLGPAEILVILFVALIVFGPQRLPEVGRQVGSMMRELRRMQDTVRGELDSVLHPDVAPSFDEPAEPGDHHGAISTQTGSSEITGPDDVATPPAEVDTPAEDDPRFSGPSDSFI